MAIGTPVNQGVNSGASGGSATVAITTLATVSAGDLIWVASLTTGGQVMTSIADSLGNNYTLTSALAGFGMICGYLIAPSSVPSGTTITLTWASAAGRKYATATSVSGIAPSAPLIQLGTETQTTSSTVTLVTSALSDPNAIIFVPIYISQGSADGWVEDPAFTGLATVALDTRILRQAYEVVNATTAVTYTAINGSPVPVSRTWTGLYAVFKAASSAPPSTTGTALMMGVG